MSLLQSYCAIGILVAIASWLRLMYKRKFKPSSWAEMDRLESQFEQRFGFVPLYSLEAVLAGAVWPLMAAGFILLACSKLRP